MGQRFAFVLFRNSTQLAIAVLLSLTAFSQQPKVLAPHKPIAAQVPRALEPHDAATLRSLTGGLWMIDANMRSSLYLRNNVEESAITVTPILFLSNGARYALEAVKIEPEATAVVSINDALNRQGIAPWATLMGYVEVQYTWAWDPVCATVVSVDPIHSVIFTYGLQPAPSPDQNAAAAVQRQHAIDGMWWKQEGNVDGFLALSNTLGTAVSTTVQVTDAGNRSLGEYSVTVSPHGTKMVELREVKNASSGAGGLRITYDGPEHGLVVNGGLEDLATGYSAEMPLRPPLHVNEKSTSTTWTELGLMTGAADPMMSFPTDTVFSPFSLVRNVSDEPVAVTPTLYWMEGSAARSAQGTSFRLLPGETMMLDVRSLLVRAGLENFNGSVNLTLSVLGRAHSVLLASGSVDAKNTYVFQVLPRAVLESAAKTVSYWDTANGDDTMITVWNPADEAQDYALTLSFSGGHYVVPMHLEARATRMLNISELIQSQTPDRDGDIIPAGIREGSAKISGIHAENESILVALDSGTYNVRKATCTYYCISCDGEVLTYLVVSPFAVAKGGTDQLTFEAKWNTGSVYYLNNNTSTWSSNNTGIATVSTGLVKGVSPGGVTISAFSPTSVYNANYCAYDPYCPYTSNVSGSGPGGVGPYQVEPISTASQGQAQCTQGYAGWVRNVTNQVQYQSGAAFGYSGLTAADNLSPGSTNQLGMQTQTGSYKTTGDGSFPDTYYVCSTACPSTKQTDALQNWNVNGVPLPHVNGIVYTCSSITIDGR